MTERSVDSLCRLYLAYVISSLLFKDTTIEKQSDFKKLLKGMRNSYFCVTSKNHWLHKSTPSLLKYLKKLTTLTHTKICYDQC